MRSHGFRKFYISQMIKAKVDYNTKEYLVGHQQSRGLDVNYDRTSEEDRLAEYTKDIDLLTIVLKQRLQKENQELKSHELQELDQLKTELKVMNAKTDELTNFPKHLGYSFMASGVKTIAGSRAR